MKYSSSYTGHGKNYRSGYESHNNHLGRYEGPMQARPVVKHSGSQLKFGWVSKKTGEKIEEKFITGWNYSKTRGMISIIGAPRKKGTATRSKDSEMWTVKVRYADGRKPEYMLGFFHVPTNRLFVNDLQMVANPSKNYFGSYFKRKK